jgi:hypothetical protein
VQPRIALKTVPTLGIVSQLEGNVQLLTNGDQVNDPRTPVVVTGVRGIPAPATLPAVPLNPGVQELEQLANRAVRRQVKHWPRPLAVESRLNCTNIST